ncbi:MAG: alkaline phosphatase family protein [Chloroflexi bacterium]|nr:alkaline phosphatase family protein [Chloroflexota bacterium]
MRPVLTFFFDALKPESLKYMPFLDSFPYKRRMRSELGHSVTCHPSMYSGVHPNKHLQWFVWKYDPGNTPFRWARVFKYLGFVDNVGSRYFLHKYTRQYRPNNTSWFGVPLLVNVPLRYWPYFNVVEDRAWDEPGYLKTYPTVFDILRSHSVQFEIVGMTKGAGSEFNQIGNHRFAKIRPWTYFFLGSIDGYSHKYGQDAPETIDRMRRLDQLVESKYRAYEQLVPEFDVFVFSDHGHIPAPKRVDIHAVFQQHGVKLSRFIHLIESNYARFWFRNDRERAIVERVLSGMHEGLILQDEHFHRYHLEMPDNRYGDLVFYLDAPYLFSKTIWGFSRGQKSMHGYLPDHPASDGLFLSQRPLVAGEHAELVDILPTLLASLGLPIPGYADGQVLWEKAEALNG